MKRQEKPGKPGEKYKAVKNWTENFPRGARCDGAKQGRIIKTSKDRCLKLKWLMD